MADRNFVLKWAHIGLGKNPRYRRIIDEERRALDAHIAEIQAEQEQRNTALHEIDHSHIPPLRTPPGMPLGATTTIQVRSGARECQDCGSPTVTMTATLAATAPPRSSPSELPCGGRAWR